MSQIPKPAHAQFSTRNTKEAALLYALNEVEPCVNPDGSAYAFKVFENGNEVCWFSFKPGKQADQIHNAFSNPREWIEKHANEIPDELMPTVIALILQSWHNWERLKEWTQGLPLHKIVVEGNKITIAGVKR